METRSSRKRKSAPEVEEVEDTVPPSEDSQSSKDPDTDHVSKRRKMKSDLHPDSPDSLEEMKENSDGDVPLLSKPLCDTLSIVSWNVNGSNAWTKSGAWKYIPEKKPDVICLQEVKASAKKFPIELKTIGGYTHYLYSAVKDGYAGTAILSRTKPISVSYGIGAKKHNTEGRVITAEYDKHYLVTSYTPNSGRGLVRLGYRKEWDADFKEYLCTLDKKKPVILCGDLNVAHEEIDIANPVSNRNKTAGFTDQEREGFTKLLKGGFVDSYRKLYPDKKGAYTWWSYMNNARGRNIGWRLDYFVISERMMDQVEDVVIEADVKGSDHCPLQLKLNVSCL